MLSQTEMSGFFLLWAELSICAFIVIIEKYKVTKCNSKSSNQDSTVKGCLCAFWKRHRQTDRDYIYERDRRANKILASVCFYTQGPTSASRLGIPWPFWQPESLPTAYCLTDSRMTWLSAYMISQHLHISGSSFRQWTNASASACSHRCILLAYIHHLYQLFYVYKQSFYI